MNLQELKTSIVAKLPKLPKFSKPAISIKLNFKLLWVFFAAILIGFAIYLGKGLAIAAFVNGKPVTRFEIVKELERRGGQQALEGLINQNLIEQEGKKRGIVITKADLAADLTQIEANAKSSGTTLDAYLAKNGLTRVDFMSILKTNKILEKLIADKVVVTDDEITAYITANKEQFPKETDMAAAKPQVKVMLQQQKVDAASQSLINQLRSTAKIYYWVKYQ